MGRSTGFSRVFSILRAGSAATAGLATILSCSDNSTAPSALSRRDPALAGIKVVVVHVPDSLKNPGIRVSGTQVLSAPHISRDVVAAPTASAPSTYTVSTVAFQPEPSPINVLISTDPRDPTIDCGDCVAFHVPIGFAFTFYGNSYSELQVSSNGLVGLGSGLGTEASPLDGCCSGWGIPSNDLYNNIIALAWTDWTPSAAADVRFETQGTAPNRKFVLQWNNVPEYIPGTGHLTGQIVLSEGSNDITMYTTSMNVTNMWHMVTQGIENADGSEAAFLPGRVQQQFSLSNDAIRFSIQTLSNPIVLVPAANVQVGTDAHTCVATVALTPPSVSGGGNGLTIVGVRNDRLALDAGYPKGVTTITWTATDASGLTVLATQTVTVSDHEPPQITLPANVVVPNDPGLASAYVNVGSAHVEDNCPNYSINDPANGVYPVGTTQVVWTAIDESGNTSSATQLVTVKDVEAPTISVSSNLTVNATSPAGALVSFANFGHDNVGVTSFACDNMTGTVFPIGTTSVSCSAVDAAGNRSAPASFTVTVLGAPQQIANLIEYMRGAPNIDPVLEEPAKDGRKKMEDFRDNRRDRIARQIPESDRTELIEALESALSNPRTTRVACRGLTLFMNAVRAKTPSVFPADISAQILSDAARIAAVMACSDYGLARRH